MPAKFSLFSSILALAGIFCGTSLPAVTITSSQVQNGGTFFNTGGGPLVISHSSNDPLLTLTGGATSANIDSITIGNSSSERGNLLIEDNSHMESLNGATLGNLEGSFGKATVSGTGSSWDNPELVVGESGTGELWIEAGGFIVNDVAVLGRASSPAGVPGSGTATVTGMGSRWDNILLHVGYFGTGNLSIEDEGEVVCGYCSLGKESAAQGTATVTGSGSTLTTTTLEIGSYGIGDLSIENGGKVNNTDGLLGSFAGSSGTLTVKGSGSSFNSESDLGSSLTIGMEGTGVLNVEAGGEVGLTSASLGIAGSSQGTVLVTGAGSKLDIVGTQYIGVWIPGYPYCNEFECIYIPGRWEVTPYARDTIIGKAGQGTVTVADGGRMTIGAGVPDESTVGDTYLGQELDSHGELIVTGENSSWESVTDLYIGDEGAGTLTLETGGLVKSFNSTLGNGETGEGIATVTGANTKWENGSYLTIGNAGTGELRIEDGALVTSLAGRLGEGSTGHGTVTISGGSWQTDVPDSEYLVVGVSGTGELLVEQAGELTSQIAHIGWDASSTGTVTVTGSDSKWTNSGAIFVGGGYSATAGTVMLTVSDGGEVSTSTLYASMEHLQGNGTIAAHGVVLDNVDLVFDSTHGLQQVLPFGTGGQLQLNVDGTGVMGAGHKGTGSLTIADGIVVNSTAGQLGVNSVNAVGRATITGEGSKWLMSEDLAVGHFGTGELTVQLGGEVSNVKGSLGGTATISGAGSQWNNSQSLTIGFPGTTSVSFPVGAQEQFLVPAQAGTLLIEDGGKVTSLSSTMQSGSSVTITGLNSQWENSGILDISGGSQLMIENGGKLINAGSALNLAQARVTGANSVWQNSSSLTLGVGSYAADLDIEDGGVVTSSVGSLARGSVITVNGANSAWLNSGDLLVGHQGGPGQAKVLIQEGGKVTNSNALLGGRLDIQHGLVEVTGTGSLWSNSGNLNVGDDPTLRIYRPAGQPAYGEYTPAQGTAQVDVNNGGKVIVGGTLSLATNGTVNLGPGGIVQTNNLHIGDSLFYYQTTEHVLPKGTFNFTGGTLIVNGEVTGELTVPDGGIFGGTATVPNLIVGSGGAISPGSSPGTIVAVDSEWQSSAKYIWEINATGEMGGTEGDSTGWDLINISNQLSITSMASDPFLIELHSLKTDNDAGLLAGFNSNTPYSWLIATAPAGTFGDLSLLAIDDSGFSNSLNGGAFSLLSGNGGSELLLEFTPFLTASNAAVPEPSSQLLVLCALCSLMLRSRSRRARSS